MRIIAGTARSMPLKALSGTDTRPTTDRIKETLFNMIQTQVPGSVFLDLFSGSGQIALEALSRGAEKAVLVENSKKAVSVITDNVTFTKMTDRAVIKNMDAVAYINTLPPAESFDLIFMDPPYGKGLEYDVLKALSASDAVRTDTTIIIETDLFAELSSFTMDGVFEVQKEKRYKTNRHIFLKKRA